MPGLVEAMKHILVFHSVFQRPNTARPEKTFFSRERGAFCERLSTYTYIDIVSVRAGCRYTTYEKEPQVSK